MEIVQVDTTHKAVEEWLVNVVIGLNLCPFAARPKQLEQIDIVVSDAQTQWQLLADLQAEMKRLIETPSIVLETTLLAVPHLLHNFDDYNQFLNIADNLLAHCGYEGILQIASFHPSYQFEGTKPDDAENLTNRSPVPLFHILRELSLSEALDSSPNPEQIPTRNILKMNKLSADEKQRLFHYLKIVG